MNQPEVLSARFGAVTVSVDTREAIRQIAQRALSAEASFAAPFGLTLEQEPKYTVDDFGQIINRQTSAPIPSDEPIMLFRAKDVHTRAIARRYVDVLAEGGHKKGGFERYQRFVEFADKHPERMRAPE